MKAYIQEVTVYKQTKGMDQSVVDFMAIINVKELIAEENLKSFILKLEIVANGYTYHYTNIFKMEDIDDKGDLIIGQLHMIGPFKTEDLQITAEIIYLEAVG